MGERRHPAAHILSGAPRSVLKVSAARVEVLGFILKKTTIFPAMPASRAGKILPGSAAVAIRAAIVDLP